MEDFESKMAPSPVPALPIPPMIISYEEILCTVGGDYQYTPAATGETPMVWELVEGPPDMVINTSYGTVIWQSVDLGQHPVTIRVTNEGGDDEQSFVIDVVEVPPVIISSPPLDAVTGVEYLYMLESRGTAPLDWSLLQAPDGMSIDGETGNLTWEDPVEGSHFVITEASNPAGKNNQLYTLTVGSLPGIVSSLTDIGSEGSEYNHIPDVSGSIPRVWTINGAPGGMIINSVTGVIYWPTPTVGTHRFIIIVANRAGYNSFSFSLDIS